MNLENINNDLLDTNINPKPLDISNENSQVSLGYLKKMIRIRITEKKLALERKQGNIGGPVHLGVGQEAVAVGISSQLKKTDMIFGAHRSHSHLLAMGSSIYKLFAEVLGRDTGHSKGMGGSMHLIDESNGFIGSVPIVAGTVPLAVGAAMSAKFKDNQQIAISYLGDGAIEEGVVHESLNLSSILKLPIIFVLENNLYSSHMHISQRQPTIFTSRFGIANNIHSRTIDGNNIFEVISAAKEAAKISRFGKGPTFIEAITYRFFGHVDWREDIDVGINRSEEEIKKWRLRDPIKRLKDAMIKEDLLTEEIYENLNIKIKTEINEYWEEACKSPYPLEKELLDRVYFKKK